MLQLIFYGAYHSNKINFIIHLICVPFLLWFVSLHNTSCPTMPRITSWCNFRSGLVMGCEIPKPSFMPSFNHEFNQFLVFDLNWPFIYTSLSFLYYLALDPVATVCFLSYFLRSTSHSPQIVQLIYAPQLALTLLSAIAFSNYQRFPLTKAGIIHVSAWIAQFLGHGLAEKRSPALVDNLLSGESLFPIVCPCRSMYLSGRTHPAVVLAPLFVHFEILFYFGYKPDLQKRLRNGVGAEIARIKRADAEKKRAAEKKEL